MINDRLMILLAPHTPPIFLSPPPLSFSDDGLLPQIFHSHKTKHSTYQLTVRETTQTTSDNWHDSSSRFCYVRHNVATAKCHIATPDALRFTLYCRPPSWRFIHLTINQTQPPTYTPAHTHAHEHKQTNNMRSRIVHALCCSPKIMPPGDLHVCLWKTLDLIAVCERKAQQPLCVCVITHVLHCGSFYIAQFA